MKSHFKKRKIHEPRCMDWETDEAQQMLGDVATILEQHFAKYEEMKFNSMANWFLMHFEVALAEMWCREDERKKLAKLKDQTRKLAETYNSIHWLIQSNLSLNSTLPLNTVNGAYAPSVEHEKYSVRSDEHPPQLAFSGLETLAKNFEGLFPAVEMTSQKMHEGIPYKKRAYEAWRVVDAAAALCRAYPNTITVPSALNPTGPFGRLLEDLFEYFEIETSPQGAFKGWYANVDNNEENLDLPPIY